MLSKRCGLLSLLICTVNSVIGIEPIVKTDIGVIKGLRADDGDYSMYLGVPFASVNASNPFGTAIPHPGFENAFEAYDDDHPCSQREEYNNTLVGTLDCLRMNIFVPDSASPDNRLPVLAYIYGGSYVDGYYNRYLYGAKFLMKHDIIFVSINYRGGTFGFMCLDIPEVPGNQGLKDQVLALRWIKRHIGAFGGDESKITLGGNSAGSMSIDMHMQSNTEALHEQAILQSGTSLIPVFHPPVKNAPLILSEHLGYNTNDMNAAIEFLAKLNPHSIVTAVEDLGLIEHFKPCVEKEFDGVESFLTKNWRTARMTKIKNMPILIGITNDEKCGYYPSYDDKDYQNVVEQKLSMCFDLRMDTMGMKDLVNQFYFGDEPASAALRESVIDFDSDIHFLYPIYNSIRRYLENEAGNIYFQVFSYVGERNFVRLLFNTTRGRAQHGDDIGYVFDLSYLKHIPITQEDQLIIDRITTIWTNFVKYGNPVPHKSDLLPVDWPPVTKEKFPYLDINLQLVMKSRPYHQRAAFWDLFYRANRHLHRAYPDTLESNLDQANDAPVYTKTEL